MSDINLFCDTGKGFKAHVGTIYRSENTGNVCFIKNKAHLMRIIGENGGYGIQKEVKDYRKKKHDLLEFFRKHPEIKVIIPDADNGNIYSSTARDWTEHFHKGNYGDGKQIFLSVNYMKHVSTTTEAE